MSYQTYLQRYSNVYDVEEQIRYRFELTIEQEQRLAAVMFNRGLDPRDDADLSRGFRLIGLDAKQFGIAA